MSPFLNFLAWSGWLILVGLAMFVVGTILRFDEGHWLFRVADRKDQQRMVAVIAAQERRALDEDASVAELDAVWDLPAFGGWRG